jgi:hypothetical protein
MAVSVFNIFFQIVEVFAQPFQKEGYNRLSYSSLSSLALITVGVTATSNPMNSDEKLIFGIVVLILIKIRFMKIMKL